MSDCSVGTTMKPNKSPENAELTPSKKKLKQARLPFKLLSEVSPTPVTPQTRKRKLSSADAETVPKIGKLSKENDLTENNTVVISDDEISDTEKSPAQDKPLNPFVKLVDTAWKKKLQKNKKKKNDLKSDVTSNVNGLTDATSNENSIGDSKNEIENMDVDLPLEEDKDKTNENQSQAIQPELKNTSPQIKKPTPKRKTARRSKASPRNTSKLSNKNTVSASSDVTVEDSNEPDIQEVNYVKNDESEQTPLLDSETEQAMEKDSTEDIKKDLHNSSPEKDIVSDSSSINTEPPTVPDENIKVPVHNEKSSDKTLTEDNKVPNSITPKRSSRNKTKVEEKEKMLNKSSSKLDDSITSNPLTPKHNRSLSVTNSLDDSLNESTTSANLTPKQV